MDTAAHSITVAGQPAEPIPLEFGLLHALAEKVDHVHSVDSPTLPRTP